MLNPEDNVLAEWFVDNRYTEVDSRNFYREIFPDGLFDVRDAKTPDVGRGLVQTIQKPTKKDDSQFQTVGKTIPVYDDLTELYQTIDDSVKLYEQYQRRGVADRVQILTCTNGCSYMGHECLAENVYMMSAMIIEIDDIIYDENGMAGSYCYNRIGLKNMLNQMRPVEMPRSGRIRPAVYPTPTYIVCSGSGMHLYYVFQEPLRINKKYFPKHYEAVDLYKKCLMGALWRSKTITEKPVEIQGIAQRYRCVGSPNKTGSVVRAFQIGDKVSLEYMNSFRDNLKYEDENHRFQECPELSEIVNTAPGTARPYKKRTYSPTGNLGKGAYIQALERIKTSAMEGKRYWFLYCLAATARMCAIPEKQLKADAYNLLDFMNSLTITPDNEFTIDRNLGSDRAGRSWYNEGFTVGCIEERYAVRVGFGDEDHNKRSAALNIKANGKLDNRQDMFSGDPEKNRSYQFFTATRSTVADAGSHQPGWIGTYDGTDIQLPNIHLLLCSKRFYTGNTTVMDLN